LPEECKDAIADRFRMPHALSAIEILPFGAAVGCTRYRAEVAILVTGWADELMRNEA
jgi:hypothetical protein